MAVAPFRRFGFKRIRAKDFSGVADLENHKPYLFDSVWNRARPHVVICNCPHIVMNTVDENRLTMVTTTTEVLLQFKDVWKDHVAFARGVTALEAQQETIEEQALIAAGESGAAQAKQLALTALGQAGAEIIGAVLSYATENSLPELAGKVNYAPSALIAGKARQVVSRATAVHAAASEVVAELTEYGITAAKLTAFKRKIDAFDGLKTSPRSDIVKRSAANLLLPQLVRTAVNILKEQLDGLMVQFKDAQPNFYQEYFAARNIVSARGSTDEANSTFNKTKTSTPTPQPVTA